MMIDRLQDTIQYRLLPDLKTPVVSKLLSSIHLLIVSIIIVLTAKFNLCFYFYFQLFNSTTRKIKIINMAGG